MKRWFISLLCMLMPVSALASDTDAVAAVAPLLEARDAFYLDAAKFQAGELTEAQLVERIGNQFAPLLDNQKIALRVMGRFARQSSAVERSDFTSRLQASLTDAYAKGLTVYGGEELVLPSSGVILKPGRALVESELRASGKEPLPIQFALGYDAELGWRVENVVVAGINLGLTLRNQFAELVKTTGSVQGAIDAWSFENASQGMN